MPAPATDRLDELANDVVSGFCIASGLLLFVRIVPGAAPFGTNATGITFMDVDLVAKRMEVMWLIQSKPELGNNGGAAPTGGETFGVCDRINTAARMCVGVASQDEAISLREIGVIIA
jgi:hypothetical protein